MHTILFSLTYSNFIRCVTFHAISFSFFDPIMLKPQFELAHTVSGKTEKERHRERKKCHDKWESGKSHWWKPHNRF